ncbi:hypothetical protein NFJ02_41g107730 [Pycnococcus provasolii]
METAQLHSTRRRAESCSENTYNSFRRVVSSSGVSRSPKYASPTCEYVIAQELHFGAETRPCTGHALDASGNALAAKLIRAKADALTAGTWTAEAECQGISQAGYHLFAEAGKHVIRACTHVRVRILVDLDAARQQPHRRHVREDGICPLR